MTAIVPLTPYVTPVYLVNAPTGISWNSIPFGSGVTPAEREAEQLNVCARATGQADAYCNQVLRATIDTEQLSGPDYRVTIQNDTGNARIILQRWPITEIVSVEVAPNAQFPRQWVSLPSGYWDIEYPIIGLYGTNTPSAAGEGGQSVVLAPGYVDWCLGRRGYVIRITYVNGWPHTALTADVAAGATTLPVNDCTGWAPFSSGLSGASGTIYDTGQQEAIQATTASAQSGPGNVTVANPLMYSHAAGTMVSTFPQSMMWAIILMATAQALTRGATATSVHTIPGGGAGTPALKGPVDLLAEAELLLNPYKRTI